MRKTSAPRGATPSPTPAHAQMGAPPVMRTPALPRWELCRCPGCKGEFVIPRVYRTRGGKIILDFSVVYCPSCDRIFHTDVEQPVEVARDR